MVVARVARKMIPGAFVLWDSISESLSVDSPQGGWETQTLPGTPHVFVYRFDYLDLSGYAGRDLTLFPQSVNLQQLQPVKGSGSHFYRLDLATKNPVSFDDINNYLTPGIPAPPGSMASTDSIEQVFMGRLQLWEEMSTISGLSLTQETAWGVGDATAGAKLYLTTVYYIDQAATNTFNIPEGAWVIPSLIDREDDLEYVMRLARSYELQG